jgi:hypothetical protein
VGEVLDRVDWLVSRFIFDLPRTTSKEQLKELMDAYAVWCLYAIQVRFPLQSRRYNANENARCED